MATKATVEMTCDLCAAQVHHAADRPPIGWQRIDVTAVDAPEGSGMRAQTEPRDICPFCWEELEKCLRAHPQAAKREGAR